MDPVTGIIIAVALSTTLGLVVGITLTTYRARLARHFLDIENTINGRIEELDRRIDRHVEVLDRRIDSVSIDIEKLHENEPS